MAVQRRLDVAVARPGIAIEQRLRRHHHAVAAVAALAGLLLDERPLERMQRLDGAEPLDRRDVALRDARDRRHAGAHGLAVHQHRARAALREPAAELGAVQLEIVAQYIKEGRVRLDRDRPALAVDPQREVGHVVSLRLTPPRPTRRGSGERRKSRSATAAPGRSERWGMGERHGCAGALRTRGDRGAPRLRRGAPNAGGMGAMSGPPSELMTRSPGLTSDTPAPTAVTRPTHSAPGVAGSGGLSR